MDITDTANVPITYLSFSQAESIDSSVFVIRVTCIASMFLAAADIALVRVLARRHGTADAFVDIAITPIDLTPYAGGTIDFDIKLHTEAVTGLISTAVELKVIYTP